MVLIGVNERQKRQKNRKGTTKQREFLQKMVYTLMIDIDALDKTPKRNKKIIIKQKEACTI